MSKELFYKTLSPLLRSILELLMKEDGFKEFRLVGGTALSLQLGHRESVDIDLFTEAKYGSVDFNNIENFLEGQFSYLDTFDLGVIGPGKSYFVGDSEDQSIKLDLWYTDPFIRPVLKVDGIRLTEVDDIVAMKIDVVGRGGRKKDFWDLHELLSDYSIEQMLQLHQERYPYTHNKKEILSNFIKFKAADADFDPVCLRGKYWEVIKLDLLDALNLHSHEKL